MNCFEGVRRIFSQLDVPKMGTNVPKMGTNVTKNVTGAKKNVAKGISLPGIARKSLPLVLASGFGSAGSWPFGDKTSDTCTSLTKCQTLDNQGLAGRSFKACQVGLATC